MPCKIMLAKLFFTIFLFPPCFGQIVDNYSLVTEHTLLDDPILGFVRISNWRPLNFCKKKCEVVSNKTASLQFWYEFRGDFLHFINVFVCCWRARASGMLFVVHIFSAIGKHFVSPINVASVQGRFTICHSQHSECVRALNFVFHTKFDTDSLIHFLE